MNHMERNNNASGIIRKEKSCGIVVFAKDGKCWKVLLIRHKAGSHWAFPKGHVEKNENEFQTAIREVREETGVKAQINTHFRTVISYSSSRKVLKDVVYFAAVLPSIQKTRAQESEIQEVKWCDISKAGSIITFPNDKQVLRDAIGYLIDHFYGFGL